MAPCPPFFRPPVRTLLRPVGQYKKLQSCCWRYRVNSPLLTIEPSRSARPRLADKEIARVLAAPEVGLQHFYRATDHASFDLDLHRAPIKWNTDIHCREAAECTFATYVGGINCRAILQNSRQRKHCAPRNISVFEKAADLANDGTGLEFDGLRVRTNSLGDRAKQSIASGNRCLNLYPSRSCRRTKQGSSRSP